MLPPNPSCPFFHAGQTRTTEGKLAAGAKVPLRPTAFGPGEIRDHSFEQQRYRASGLNLVTAAIILWNTVYLERATHALRAHGQEVDDSLPQHLSPLGWEHINLTGDYIWRQSRALAQGKFQAVATADRPLAYDFFRFLRRPL